MRVLVIDDSKLIQGFVKSCLQDSAHQVVIAENGQIGIEVLTDTSNDSSFDVILLDWNMPVLDGPGFLQKIQDKNIITGPILMMTTENSPQKIMQALSMGASEYLMKPFTAEILLDKIETAIRQKKAA
jgi:two-component system chemotaxis response regulator CheY